MNKLLLLFILAPMIGWTQGYQVNLQGQTQQGMGSAGTAYIQDAAAVFFNPGGLSFLEQNQATASLTLVTSSVQFNEANTNMSANTVSPVGTPFAAYANYKIKDSSRWSFGLGVYTPFGSTVEWSSSWVGRFTITRLQLLSIFVQPTVSFKLADKIGIGAGFVYSYGKVNLQKDIPVKFQNGEYGSAELAGTSNGFGFNAGFYYEPDEWLSIGVTYRSQVNMDLKSGVATFNVPSSLEENFPSGAFTASLPLPSVATFGLLISPSKKLKIAIDVSHVGWVAYDTLGFDYELNTESLEDTKSPRNYENTFAFRLGGEYAFTDKFKFRAGLSMGESPVQDGYVTGETPDAFRVGLTAGFGYTIQDHFQLDFSMLYTQFDRTDTNIETQLSGTYKVNAFAPGLSISYLF